MPNPRCYEQVMNRSFYQIFTTYININESVSLKSANWQNSTNTKVLFLYLEKRIARLEVQKSEIRDVLRNPTFLIFKTKIPWKTGFSGFEMLN